MMRALIWSFGAGALLTPLILAGQSPYLAWRDPVYIVAGFAGIAAMCALVLQPVLAANLLPGSDMRQSKTLHRWLGAALIALIVLHVGGLWITSPPDVMDALLLASPTPFAVWGVLAMWALFAAAIMAATRRKWSLRAWRRGHATLAVITVIGTVLHALLIEGTMEPLSKWGLSALLVLVTLKALHTLGHFGALKSRH